MGLRHRLIAHIGAPKTGTTYIQAVMWANRKHLAGSGFELLARGQREMFAAGTDLIGDGGTPLMREMRKEGAWDSIAARLVRSNAATVCFTDERLAALKGPGLEQVAALGAERDVHVVYTTRNLAALLPSAWQEHVKHGSTESLEEWLDRILRMRRGKSRQAWFWRVHDVPSVLDRWSQVVTSPANIHVLTMPQDTSDPAELWSRFARAVGLPEVLPPTAAPRTNPSLDYAQVEFLRALNIELDERISRPAHIRWVRDALSKQAMAGLGAGPRATLPTRFVDEVEAISRETIAALEASDYDVVGNLDDLAPVAAPATSANPALGDVLDASVQAMAAFLSRLEDKPAAKGTPGTIASSPG